MKDDRLHLPVRLALLYYFVRRLNLDVDDETPDRPANERHVVLANPDEVREAQKRAMHQPKVPENTKPLERARA